jgi:putative dehydrogenase
MPAATARHRPLRQELFSDFAKQSADLGAFGNGSRMKFVANHLVAIHNVATAEAMILAERAGLDPKMVVDMVGPGAGGSRMFQMRAPMMVEGVYEPATMKVSTWKKDMAIIAEFADDVGCATPLFTLTQPVYTQAMAMGLGDQDTAAVFEVLKKTIVSTAPILAALKDAHSLYRTASKRIGRRSSIPDYLNLERTGLDGVVIT